MISVKRHPLKVIRDERGHLAEIWRSDSVPFLSAGQVNLVRVNPGEKRGGHYHRRKSEWFLAAAGKGWLGLGEFRGQEWVWSELPLSGQDPELIEIPPGIGHRLRADPSTPLLVLIYIDEIYHPEDADVHPAQ